MRRWKLCTAVALTCLTVWTCISTARAMMIMPQPGPNRVINSDAVVVGKVIALEPQERQGRPANLPYRHCEGQSDAAQARRMPRRYASASCPRRRRPCGPAARLFGVHCAASSYRSATKGCSSCKSTRRKSSTSSAVRSGTSSAARTIRASTRSCRRSRRSPRSWRTRRPASRRRTPRSVCSPPRCWSRSTAPSAVPAKSSRRRSTPPRASRSCSRWPMPTGRRPSTSAGCAQSGDAVQSPRHHRERRLATATRRQLPGRHADLAARACRQLSHPALCGE